MQKELYEFLQDYHKNSESEALNWASLEEGVIAFNDAHGTSFDPHDTVLAYLTGV